MKNWSDEEIISCLLKESFEKDKALKQLYIQLYPIIKSFIIKNNGTEEDAADIFQDGIIVFYEKVRLNQFQLTSSIRTYVYSVCKHLWLNKLRAQKKLTSLTEESESMTVEPLSLNIIGTKEKNAYLIKLLDSLGENCKQVLLYYYYDRLKMRQIADRMNFANEQVAKNKKSSCLKKLKSLVSNSAHIKDMLE